MRTNSTEKMVTISLLAGISYLLIFLAVPILPVFSWLTLDFSDIPVLIGTFIFGPLSGILVAFIRSTLHFITSGGNLISFIGDSAGFIASVSYLLPVYLLTKNNKNPKNLILGLGLSTLTMTLAMSIANYFVITPFYMNVLGWDFGMSIYHMVLYGIVPFNLIKGIIVGIVFVLIYKNLLPYLNKMAMKHTTLKK